MILVALIWYLLPQCLGSSGLPDPKNVNQLTKYILSNNQQQSTGVGPVPQIVMPPEASSPSSSTEAPTNVNLITDSEKGYIKYYAHVAAAAYYPNCVMTWSCGPNCKATPDIIPKLGFTSSYYQTFSFVATRECEKEIIISFRGTETSANWYEDAHIELVKWPGSSSSEDSADVLVHNGFLYDYLSFSASIMNEVQKLFEEKEYKQVRCTGHSLGAAMATICALDMVEKLPPNIKVYLNSYESPRVGNANWARLLENKIPIDQRIRLTNKHDVIPHLPPQAFGYEHIAGEIFIPPFFTTANCTAIKCDPLMGEDPNCSAGYMGDSVEDHSELVWGVIFGYSIDQDNISCKNNVTNT